MYGKLPSYRIVRLECLDAQYDNQGITVLIKKLESQHSAINHAVSLDEVEWSSLHKILTDTTRRRLLELLAEKQALSYTEIMTLLQITNTGRLNYHRKALGNLISKEGEGKYRLTERGQLAVNLLRTFPERAPAEKLSTLKITVAVVLILVGILLKAHHVDKLCPRLD